MKNVINRTHIEGVLYQHSLQSRVSGDNSAKPGTEFITGSIEIATDNEMVNIVPVHFTYVTAVTSTGKTNSTYGVLKDIISGKYYWIDCCICIMEKTIKKRMVF